MDVTRLVGPAPAELRLGSDKGEQAFELADDVVATHDADPTPSAVMSLEGDRISVEPVDAVESREVAVGPVYRRADGGGLVVPSGRVFVRFAPGESASAHADELGRAGYRLEEVPSYAPNAAWVRPASGRVVDALDQLEGVRRLPAVEHAEPQLLSEAAPRR